MTHHEEHNHPEDRTVREREVIVTDRDRGGGVGTVIAAVVGIILVLVVGWMLFAGGGADVDDGGIEVPSEVDVNVDAGNGGGEG